MPLLHTNNDPIEGAIEVTSTSRQTARTDDIPLRQSTDQTRLVFSPTIVDNSKTPENSVSGKLLYERKAKGDELFPSDRGDDFISKRSVRKDDALEIALSTSEVRALYLGLQMLYKMHDDIGEIESGTMAYVLVDRASRTLLQLLKSDASTARLMADADTFELVRELLKILTQGSSRDSLASVLKELADGNISQLSTELDLEMLARAARDMRANLNNPDEEYWQSAILEKYPWVVGHVFATPCMLFASKAYVGGKAIDNKKGHVVDFLYQNKLTGNVSLVEIKTPCTGLLGKEYRNGSYSISTDLSGAVTQVLSYKQTLLNEFAVLQMNSSTHMEAFSPKCVILAGCLSQFVDSNGFSNRDKLSSFENFRNNLNGISILTFDELLQRVEDLISILDAHGRSIDVTAEKTNDSANSVYSQNVDVENIPF